MHHFSFYKKMKSNEKSLLIPLILRGYGRNFSHQTLSYEYLCQCQWQYFYYYYSFLERISPNLPRVIYFGNHLILQVLESDLKLFF